MPDPGADAGLDCLRAAVRAADAAVLKAIEQRFLIARQIGEVKREARLALRNFRSSDPMSWRSDRSWGGGYANLKFASPPLPALLA